jgi:hypothetical protein
MEDIEVPWCGLKGRTQSFPNPQGRATSAPPTPCKSAPRNPPIHQLHHCREQVLVLYSSRQACVGTTLGLATLFAE